MDIATTMAAVNYFNMVNTWNMLAMQDTELFTVTENGKEDEMMSGSILDTYIGKDCAVSLFNDMGGIKGKLMDVDAQWVKIETPKKGTQFINRNMISSVNFETSYSYVETQHCHLTMLKSFTLNDATSPDEAIFQRMKQWMQSLIRTSTLISRSGEKDRIVFFEEQRRIVDML